MMYNLKYLEYHEINKKEEITNMCFKVFINVNFNIKWCLFSRILILEYYT
jgi:hypothetical protein